MQSEPFKAAHERKFDWLFSPPRQEKPTEAAGNKREKKGFPWKNLYPSRKEIPRTIPTHVEVLL